MTKIGDPAEANGVYFEIVNQNLEELSDKTMQEKLWLSDGKDERNIGSFVEACCGLLDDSGLGNALKNNPDTINPQAIPLLQALKEKLDLINWRRDPQEIINDPDMESIRSLAAQLLIMEIVKS